MATADIGDIFFWFLVALEMDASRLTRNRSVVFIFNDNKIGVKVFIFSNAKVGNLGAALSLDIKLLTNHSVNYAAEGEKLLLLHVSLALTEKVEKTKQQHGNDEAKGDKTFADVIMVNGGFGIFSGFSF